MHSKASLLIPHFVWMNDQLTQDEKQVRGQRSTISECVDANANRVHVLSGAQPLGLSTCRAPVVHRSTCHALYACHVHTPTGQ